MLVANSIEIPDNCPDNCKFGQEAFYQGCMCSRCPVFNCTKTLGPDGEYFYLVAPEDYRLDWAKEWELFFAGKIDYPVLFLVPREATDA